MYMTSKGYFIFNFETTVCFPMTQYDSLSIHVILAYFYSIGDCYEVLSTSRSTLKTTHAQMMSSLTGHQYHLD